MNHTRTEQSSSTVTHQQKSIDTGDSWQRLAPISILYFTASNIKQFAQFLIYVIPALAISSNIFEMHRLSYAIAAGVGLISVMSISGLISYFFYFFRIHNRHVEVKCGVISRRHINLPFWRIQNLKIEQPFYYRPLNFALVVFDTAGSSEEEAKIVAVPLIYAQTLRKQVLADTSVSKAPSVGSPEHASFDREADEVVLNRRSIKDLIIHGITNNRVWILLGAAAPFYDRASTHVYNWLESKGLSLNHIIGEQTAAWWQLGLYTLTALIIIMALLALLSVGGALLSFYGYTLSRDKDRYIRRSGLLNKQEVSMKRSRIQMITAKQDWLDKALGRVNLYFEQNTSGTPQQPELMSPNKLLIPSITIDEVQPLINGAMPGSKIYNPNYKSVSKRFLSYWLGIWILPPVFLLSGIAVYFQQWHELVVILIVAMVLNTLMVLRWWRWGYTDDERYVYVRSGRVGLDYQCFEKYKVQQVTVVQSIFMKRKCVATLKILLASGSITIPFLPQAEAWKLANALIYAAESSRKSWM
ncbi:PH domain-containing protein [Alteromonas sp. ASW11-130]|uniref:PH domain-containing protein n=1 Tax=Alteromonas sp. ASW11-130 TaxID=3015775 RepID=UPI002241C40F|nr:PH domain-containing protein [Alteromonas sp. ASW11-130]MCW8092686.1 PH domain-containing protein [Alteromonas sp. ASW11-130]